MPRNPERDGKIGATLRVLRRRRGFSGAEVAVRMGYGANGRHYVNRWERGDRGISAACLWRYLEAIDATFSDLGLELGVERPGSRRLQEIAQELQLLAEESGG